jgi:uncharacterized repeat protein (TIGR02543 family)
MGTRSWSRIGSRIISSLALVALAAGLSACKDLVRQSDLDEFVSTGLTNVLVRSTSFSPASAAQDRIPSNSPVTCAVDLVNPQKLSVRYDLSWDIADAAFAAAPSKRVEPSSPTRASFAFTLDPALAEHKKITFKLSKYAPSINKTYKPETFSIVCDSPPNRPPVIKAVLDSGSKSLLGVILPSGITDDDLAKLGITWQGGGMASPRAETYAISSLRSKPSTSTFATDYDCYFQPPSCVSSTNYYYSVVVIDEAGQKSKALSTNDEGTLFYLSYNGNGSTGGTVPAAAGLGFGAEIVAAPQGDLVRTGYVFAGWNSAASGSGTAYAVGQRFLMPAGDLTLYARWNPTTLTARLADIADGGTFTWTEALSASDISQIREAIRAATGSVTLDLSGANLPSNTLPASAFSGCVQLVGITLPSTLEVLGPGCFRDCSGLTTLTIPDSAVYAGAQFISGCTSLTTLNLGSGFTGIAPGYYSPDSYMLQGPLTSLSTVTVAAGNPYFTVVGGALYGLGGAILFMYPPAMAGTSFAIPDGTMTISYCAFQGCNADLITVPTTINNIMSGAFGNYAKRIRFLGTEPWTISGSYPFGPSPPLVVEVPAAALEDYQAKWGGLSYETY